MFYLEPSPSSLKVTTRSNNARYIPVILKFSHFVKPRSDALLLYFNMFHLVSSVQLVEFILV
jgi:hypothetical protein